MSGFEAMQRAEAGPSPAAERREAYEQTQLSELSRHPGWAVLASKIGEERDRIVGQVLNPPLESDRQAGDTALRYARQVGRVGGLDHVTTIVEKARQAIGGPES